MSKKMRKEHKKVKGIVFSLMFVAIIGGGLAFWGLKDTQKLQAGRISIGDFRLTAINKWDVVAQKNYADLKWDSVPDLSQKGYVLYQSEDNGTTWNNRSMNYGKEIKVLNVYPNVAGSNTLSKWMQDKDISFNLIKVTPMAMSTYNSNPSSALLDNKGNYKYDVIMFGTWDSNNSQDLNVTSREVTKKFMESGRGVLFGHDTIWSSLTNFRTFETFLGISTFATGNKNPFNQELRMGSTKVKITNNGYLMKYPHEFPNNVQLTIPFAHSAAQMTMVDQNIKWLEFVGPFGITSPGNNTGKVVNHPTYGTNNHYLITKGNLAIIQTGHSNGASTKDEMKILTNTLYNLAQVTLTTSASDQSVKDNVAPSVPALEAETTGANSNEMNISIKSQDRGKKYRWYVEADVKTGKPKKSDVVEEEILSDMAGYIYLIDNKPTTVPTVNRNGYGHVTNINLPVTLPNKTAQLKVNPLATETQYVHVLAVDRAHNVSAVSHTQVRSLMTYFSINERYLTDEDPLLQTEIKPATSEIVELKADYKLTADKTTHDIKYELKEMMVDGKKIAYAGNSTMELIAQVTKSTKIDYIYKVKNGKVNVGFIDDSVPAETLRVPVILKGKYGDRINFADNSDVKAGILEVENITIDGFGYELITRPSDENNYLFNHDADVRNYIFQKIPDLHGYWVNLVVENKTLIAHYKNIDKIELSIDGKSYKTYDVTNTAAEQQLAIDIPINNFRNVVIAKGYINTTAEAVVESTYNGSKLKKLTE